MKKIAVSVLLFILLACSFAQTPVVFNGESLEPYMDQQVMFNQTLYVCGRSGNQYGGNLYLSYERLRQPEEVAIEGTAAFDSAVAKCENGVLSAYCTGAYFNNVRTGSTITNMVATVAGDHFVRLYEAPSISQSPRPTHRPDVGDATLIVCGANLQYYCPDWEGTYGAGSDEEFALQHLKTVKALVNIDADIYALTELQQGSISLETLVNGMNAFTSPGRYAYVRDNDTVTSNYIKVGFVYRTDKVRPVLILGHPYAPKSSAFLNQINDLKREEVQAFDEIATGERFILCMNHFKSKSGGDSTNFHYNADRVENAEYLIHFLNNELVNDYYDDADILIMGDLNCSTMEEPIRVLEAAGYENQLTRFSPDEYSYTFDNQVQYLDHALASPSLAAQITGTAPYHINADESYLLHYNYSGDTSMYRYSDHDPIIVGLRLQAPEEEPEQNDIRYFESMDSTFGSILAISEIGDGFWYHYANYQCACINGVNSGNNRDWLVLPTFNLTDMDSATVRFTHAFGYGTANSWGQHCKLLISKDYNGDLHTATWSQISIPNMPTQNWEWQDNTILLPQSFQGKPNVTLAFKYEVLASSDIPAWELKNIAFNAKHQLYTFDGEIGIDDEPSATFDFSVHSENGKIVMEVPFATLMEIFDIQGRSIHRQYGTNCAASVTPGLYVVRCGGASKKIMVQ